MAIDPVKLNPELAAWLKARQASLKIVKTTTTPSGKTIDWVPIESQHPAGEIATPPPAAAVSEHAEDAKQPVTPVTFELDDPKVERGPAGTVPILRPDISRLTRTIALKDFLTKRGGAKVNKHRTNKQPTDPNPAGYFHNTDSQSGKFYGWDGRINVWDPKVDIPSSPGDDHSILQVWLQNYDKPHLQSLEGGWTVDDSLNGNLKPHIFTYYTVNGYTSDGDNKGGYNRIYDGWVQHSNSIFPGIGLAPSSVFGGAQYDASMKFQLYKEPNNDHVNWWVAVQGVWMGYYPAKLYNGGLGKIVDWIGVGGEVYSSLADPEKTKDQMGSGHQAAEGWRKAAFMRNLRNQSNMAGSMVNSNGTPVSDAAIPNGADPYTIQMHINSGGSWGSYFYVGGPAK
jgi:hypothetical protein